MIELYGTILLLFLFIILIDKNTFNDSRIRVKREKRKIKVRNTKIKKKLYEKNTKKDII